RIPIQYIQLGTFLITSVILVILYRTNRNWRATRLETPLSKKCRFEENMHGIRSVLPLLIHLNICNVASLALVEYQHFTSPFALGYDMSLMNNYYGLLIAWECLWSPLLILHNFYRVRRRGTLLGKQCAFRDTEAERLAHFDSLRVTWNRADRRARSNPEIFTISS
ncbi:hypothetical protein PFISCL1PPCAC_14321, partial [Pristionchus fissidentatus]